MQRWDDVVYLGIELFQFEGIKLAGHSDEISTLSTPRVAGLLEKEVVKVLHGGVKTDKALYLRATDIRAYAAPGTESPVLTRLLV